MTILTRNYNADNKDDNNDNHKDNIRYDSKIKMMTTKLEMMMTTKMTVMKPAPTMMTTKMTVMTATLTMINDYWSGFANTVGSVWELLFLCIWLCWRSWQAKQSKNTKEGKREKDNLGERAVCGLGGHDWHREDHVSQYLHGAGDRHCDFDYCVSDHMVMILWPCPF